MDYKAYMSLLSLNYQRIYSYILMLVANHNNADDIMQETTIVMFEKFDSFEKGSDFFAWAITIAKYKTFEFLKKQKREKVIFNQEIINLLGEESKERFDKQKEWLDALKKCVSLLPKTDHQLVNLRYHENISITAIAARFGCSFQKIYREMARINNTLIYCVRRTLRLEEA